MESATLSVEVGMLFGIAEGAGPWIVGFGIATACSFFLTALLGFLGSRGWVRFSFHPIAATLTVVLGLCHAGLVLLAWGWGESLRQRAITFLGLLTILSLLMTASYGVRLSQGEFVRSDHWFFVRLTALLFLAHLALGLFFGG